MTEFEHMQRSDKEMTALVIGAALFIRLDAETLRLSRP
jgi:hypothetical protein